MDNMQCENRERFTSVTDYDLLDQAIAGALVKGNSKLYFKILLLLMIILQCRNCIECNSNINLFQLSIW